MSRPVLNIAAAVLRRGNEVVLVQQSGPGEEPFWALPGGVIDDDELATEGLVREVREETGLMVTGPIGGGFIAQLDDRRGVLSSRLDTEHGYLATVWTFEARRWTGDLLPADPDGFVSEASFVPLTEAVVRLARTRWLSLTADYLRGGVEPGSVVFQRRHRDGRVETVASISSRG